jgi:hypothetical protein
MHLLGHALKMHVEEQLLPTAFARAANVDSTFAYMGSLMTFLAKGSGNERTLRPYGVPH